MLEKYRLLKNHCKWTLQVCCIFEGIFVILSLMTLKLGNSEQNCEKKKCFKGFKTLGRRSRVLTNRGCKVLHTKFSLRSPSSHAGNAAVPLCAGVENKQCCSPPSEERGGEQGWAGGMEIHPSIPPSAHPPIHPSIPGWSCGRQWPRLRWSHPTTFVGDFFSLPASFSPELSDAQIL